MSKIKGDKIMWRRQMCAGLVLVFVFLLAGCASAPRMVVQERQPTTIRETRRVETPFTGPKRRVAVIDFENKTAYGQHRLGTSASDILITEMVKSGKFIMIERTKLNKILEEQKLQEQKIIDPDTAVKIGGIMGLNAIITGSVSQFGVKKGGADYLIVQTKQQVAEATVDVRVVDVETGQILYADSGKGKAMVKTGQFLGLGTKSAYDETLEQEALRAAITKFTRNIMYQINQKPWSCRVAEADGKEIYLDAGRESGLGIGTTLVVYHLGKAIKSPSTGLRLGYKEDKIGKIEVVRYFGGDGSIAKIVEGTAPSRADLCRLEK